MVPPGGFEPPASPLPRECSTPELRRQIDAVERGIYKVSHACQRLIEKVENRSKSLSRIGSIRISRTELSRF